MPKYKISASWVGIKRDEFLRDYMAFATECVVKAARKFLLAAYPLTREWTGMARGGFARLEDRVGAIRRDSSKASGFRIRYNSGSKTTISRPFPLGYFYRGVLRTPLAGRFYGTPTQDIITGGRITKASVNGRIVFYYQIDIDYFTELDRTLWGGFAAGRVAFDAELRSAINNGPPELTRYVTRREIK